MLRRRLQHEINHGRVRLLERQKRGEVLFNETLNALKQTPGDIAELLPTGLDETTRAELATIKNIKNVFQLTPRQRVALEEAMVEILVRGEVDQDVRETKFYQTVNEQLVQGIAELLKALPPTTAETSATGILEHGIYVDETTKDRFSYYHYRLRKPDGEEEEGRVLFKVNID